MSCLLSLRQRCVVPAVFASALRHPCCLCISAASCLLSASALCRACCLHQRCVVPVVCVSAASCLLSMSALRRPCCLRQCCVVSTELRSLQSLVLADTGVTDAGVTYYARLAPPALHMLSLSRTAVTQRIFEALAGSSLLHSVKVKTKAKCT